MTPENKAKVIAALEAAIAGHKLLGAMGHAVYADEALAIMEADTDTQDYQAKCAELELAHEALDKAELDAARYRQLLLYRGFRVAKMFDIGYGNYTPLEEVVNIISAKLDEEMEQSK